MDLARTLHPNPCDDVLRIVYIGTRVPPPAKAWSLGWGHFALDVRRKDPMAKDILRRARGNMLEIASIEVLSLSECGERKRSSFQIWFAGSSERTSPSFVLCPQRDFWTHLDFVHRSKEELAEKCKTLKARV